ncbi:hypothetical protein TL18_07735 [Methanobrevibacter sp. YE315]|uniref:hypothetical protein n=1 Tax=Methanobrevibacter sp. YE315 TaxID=1609968 RepID=UPI000764E886|nr:hypothetical protein [Methanobrevibacter sp. YE315]AMD17925.1 hypothetical protein TL18_07735 [Methanobrevibacter sp. YE315]
MKFNSKILSIMAIFLVLISAGAVCAADHAGQTIGNDKIVISANNLNNVTNTTNTTDLMNGTNSTHDKFIIPPDANHDEQHPYKNESAPARYIIPPDANHDERHPYMGNVSHNTTHKTVNATVQHSPVHQHATGNPILALLAVSAVLGACSLKRR